MPVYKVARFEVRSDARMDAERAMHDFASRTRAERNDYMWTAYRDPAAPTQFIAFSRAEKPAAPDPHDQLAAALAPFVTGTIEIAQYELVTSTDLAPRRRR